MILNKINSLGEIKSYYQYFFLSKNVELILKIFLLWAIGIFKLNKKNVSTAEPSNIYSNSAKFKNPFYN